MKGIKRNWTSGPGAFSGLSFEQYLGAEGINKSRIALLDELTGGCPAKYQAGLEERDTPSLRFGRLVHALALDGERLWIVSPFDSFRTAEAREWRDRQELPVIGADEEAEILAAAKAIRNHRLAWPLVCGGRREVSMFAEYGGRLLKCRPDVLHPDRMVDLKTTRDASTRAFQRDVVSYGYDLQAAICWKVHALLYGSNPDYYLIAIERGTTPMLNVRKLSAASIQAALSRLDALLLKLAECERTNSWPDYSGETVQEIETPAWAQPDEMAIDLTM